MTYKFKVTYDDGHSVTSKVITQPNESFRDARIRAARLASELGTVKTIALKEGSHADN